MFLTNRRVLFASKRSDTVGLDADCEKETLAAAKTMVCAEGHCSEPLRPLSCECSLAVQNSVGVARLVFSIEMGSTLCT